MTRDPSSISLRQMNRLRVIDTLYRAEVLGAAGLILAQSPHALAARVEK